MSDAGTVYVFRWQDKHPTFHLPDWFTPEGGNPRARSDGGEDYLTACGKAESTWNPSSRTEFRHIAQRMRRDHAEQIGTLCQACDKAAAR